MRRHSLPALAAAVFAAISLCAVPAQAAAISDPGPAEVAPAMLKAMQRDLDLGPAEVTDRLHTEADAPQIEQRLQARLGESFAGAWIPQGQSRMTVAVTSSADVATVRAEAPSPRSSPAAPPT